jgi:Carboxypeptidase regulatory-like domain/TonB-dependent Receptor Plug Domain
MRTRILLSALVIGACGQLLAQGFGEIHGKVLEEAGPTPGALVTAVQGENRLSSVSDEGGRFVLKPLVPGTYTVTVTMMSMRTTEVRGVQVLPDDNAYVKDIFLVPNELGPVFVTAIRWEKPMVDNSNTGVTRISTGMFKNSPLAKNPIKMIEGFTPGVVKSPNGDGLFFRGSRSENMCYFVDGVKLGSSLSGLPNNAINSMNVYTGGLPAKYGDVTGGVVAIETKSYFDLYQQRNAGVR